MSHLKTYHLISRINDAGETKYFAGLNQEGEPIWVIDPDKAHHFPEEFEGWYEELGGIRRPQQIILEHLTPGRDYRIETVYRVE